MYSVFKLSSPARATVVWQHGRDLNSPQKWNCELLRALQFIFWTCLLCSNSLLTICWENVHSMWNVEKRTNPSTGILKLLRLVLSVPFTRTNNSSGRLDSTLQNSCIYTIAIFDMHIIQITDEYWWKWEVLRTQTHSGIMHGRWEVDDRWLLMFSHLRCPPVNKISYVVFTECSEINKASKKLVASKWQVH
jgi:hypothetical protein